MVLIIIALTEPILLAIVELADAIIARSVVLPARVFAETTRTVFVTLAYVASSKPKTTGSVMQEPLQSQPVSQPATAGGDSSGGLGAPDSKAKEIPK